jgi:hypothetical protein
MTGLLEFARQEALQAEQKALIETAATQAHALMNQGSYSQVISLLEPVVTQSNDPALRILLEKANSEFDSEQLKLQSALATLQRLKSFEQWEEAVIFIEQQPATVWEHETVAPSLTMLREASEQEGAILQATGAAYSALHRSDLQAARQQSEALRGLHNPSVFATKLTNRLEARVTEVATNLVLHCIAEARQALQQRDPKRAVAILARADTAEDYAKADVRKSWHELKKRAGRARILGRVGIRVAPTDSAAR